MDDGGTTVLVQIPVTPEAAEALADADEARQVGVWVSAALRPASLPVLGVAVAARGEQASPEPVGRLARHGPLLVMPAPDGRRVTLDEANAALDEIRDGDRGP